MTSTLDRPVKAPTFQGVGARRRAKDVIATILVSLAVVIALIPLVWVLFTVIAKGLPALTSPTWFTNSLSGLTASADGGGIYHALIGTLLQGIVCAVFSIPLGIFVAIYLVEYADRKSKLGKLTTFMVDILSGVPSIVAALFIYALWIATFGFPKSAFAVSLALVLLMVPVVIRSTEEMLRIVPMDLREASYALGVPKWKTISHSAMRMRLVASDTVAPSWRSRLAKMGPARGPLTLMCFWPASLVAAIFQPATALPLCRATSLPLASV